MMMNLKNNIKNHTGLFAFLAATQILSVVIILVAYGIFTDSKIRMDEMLEEGQIYYVGFNVSAEYNNNYIGTLQKIIPEILERNETSISSIKVTTIQCDDIVVDEMSGSYSFYGDSSGITACVRMKNGKLKSVHSVPDELISGRKLKDDDENGDKCVCVVSQGYNKMVGETISIFNKNYEIVGVFSGTNMDAFRYGLDGVQCLMPLMQIPIAAQPEHVSINFNRIIYSDEYEYLNKLFQEKFGSDVRLPEEFKVDFDKEKTFRSMMWIVCILGILAAHSIISMYSFLLEKREKQTGIFLVCGAKKTSVIISYVLEMLLQFIIFVGIGYLSFQKVIRLYFDKRYKWFAYIFHENVSDCYKLLATFVGIVALTTAVSIALKIHKTPISIIKQN